MAEIVEKEPIAAAIKGRAREMVNLAGRFMFGIIAYIRGGDFYVSLCMSRMWGNVGSLEGVRNRGVLAQRTGSDGMQLRGRQARGSDGRHGERGDVI